VRGGLREGRAEAAAVHLARVRARLASCSCLKARQRWQHSLCTVHQVLFIISTLLQSCELQAYMHLQRACGAAANQKPSHFLAQTCEECCGRQEAEECSRSARTPGANTGTARAMMRMQRCACPALVT